MLLIRNFMVAVGLASILALLLSLLPIADLEDEQRHVPVFQSLKPYHLEEDNLPDLLTAFDSDLRLSRAQWEIENLFIDYKIDKQKPIYVDDIYATLFSALQSTYTLTNNVQGLYVSVVYLDEDKEEVLIALSSERTLELEEHINDVEDKRLFLQEYTTLSYGVEWSENTHH